MPAECAATIRKLLRWKWLALTADARSDTLGAPWLVRQRNISPGLFSFLLSQSGMLFYPSRCLVGGYVRHLEMAHTNTTTTGTDDNNTENNWTVSHSCTRPTLVRIQWKRKEFSTARVNNLCNYLHSFRLMSLVLCSVSLSLSLSVSL